MGFEHKGVPEEKHFVLFEGRPSPKALAMHPPTNGAARAKHRLAGAYGSLWASRPPQKRGDKEDFRVDVTGVKELELRATCRGRGHYTWAVWLDPVVSR